MEHLLNLCGAYPMEIITLIVGVGTYASAYLLPPPYASAVSFVFEKLGEHMRNVAETKGGFSNEKIDTTNTPS